MSIPRRAVAIVPERDFFSEPPCTVRDAEGHLWRAVPNDTPRDPFKHYAVLRGNQILIED